MVFDAKRKTTLCCSYCTNWSRLQSIWRRRIESPAKISALLIRFINHSEIRLRFWRAPFPFLFLILKSSFYEKIAGSIMIALSNCRETNSYAIVTTSKPKALWFINISGEKRKGHWHLSIDFSYKTPSLWHLRLDSKEGTQKGFQAKQFVRLKIRCHIDKTQRVEQHSNHYQSNHPQPLPMNCNVMPVFQS